MQCYDSYLRSPANTDSCMDLPSYTSDRADVGGWTRSQTDQFLKVEMMDECDDDHSLISADDEANRKVEVWKFIEETKQLKDVHVPTMRHILPLLLMEAYSDHYKPYVRKVKGIWKKPPPGWPSNIEFVDPNNKMKTSAGSASRKPKKELLMPMMQHLVTKLQEIQSRQHARPVQVEALTQEELSAVEMDWDNELKQRSIQLQTKLLFLLKNNLIDECMFCKLIHVQGAWSSKNSYTEDELCAIYDMDKMLSVIRLRGHITAQLSAQIDAIAAAQNTPRDIQPNELNIKQRVNGEGEVSQLMQMQDLEVRRRSTTEQSGFEAMVKLTEGGKAMMGYELTELLLEDVESQLNAIDGCGSLPSNTTDSPFMSCATDDDVASVFTEAENYGCMLPYPTVTETSMGDAVFQDTGQQPIDKSQLLNIHPPTFSYNPTIIDTSSMGLYSPSPPVASTNVQASVALQSPLSPTSVAGTLQQLTIVATPLAVSGRSGSPIQVIHYAPKQMASPNENQGMFHGKRVAPPIPSVVEEQESDDDDDDDPYAARWVKKPRPLWC